jgi:hypothetical protein
MAVSGWMNQQLELIVYLGKKQKDNNVQPGRLSPLSTVRQKQPISVRRNQHLPAKISRSIKREAFLKKVASTALAQCAHPYAVLFADSRQLRTSESASEDRPNRSLGWCGRILWAVNPKVKTNSHSTPNTLS